MGKKRDGTEVPTHPMVDIIVTTTKYEIYYECKDCGEKWTETKEETKFD